MYSFDVLGFFSPRPVPVVWSKCQKTAVMFDWLEVMWWVIVRQQDHKRAPTSQISQELNWLKEAACCIALPHFGHLVPFPAVDIYLKSANLWNLSCGGGRPKVWPNGWSQKANYVRCDDI